MLKQRVLTASVLAICFLLALFVGAQKIFALFIGAIFLLAVWEWSNLASLKQVSSRVGYTLATAAFGVVLAWFLRWGQSRDLVQLLLAIACGWWAIALLWIQSYPASSVIWGHPFIRMLMGWFVLLPAWIACLFLRSEPQGAWLVLLVVLIVASADIGAYFAGRAFGRRKLAREVSPGKSWEGVWAGMLFAGLLSVVFNFLFDGAHWQTLLIVAVPTAVMSVLGDLLESMVKRHRGVKDSGNLLPGHGGFLDRIDGLVAAIPTFSLLMLLTGWTL